VKPSPHVRSNISDDGIILLDLRTGQIFSANPIGARIWAGLEEGLSMPAIVERIVGETGADRAVVEGDVREFLDTLTLRALIGDS